MKGISQTIKESYTLNRDIERYLESWAKQAQNPREMNDFLETVINGLRAGLNYRTDPEYIDNMSKKYNEASELLKDFIELNSK